jgi:hypothetical protein
MLDMFPFPRVTNGSPETQINELITYLIHFKETLEFALMNISTENLSPELVNKLNELGADISNSKQEREEEISQISVNTLTISDVCESEQFNKAIDEKIYGWNFTVNYDTGHLEYLTKEDEII